MTVRRNSVSICKRNFWSFQTSSRFSNCYGIFLWLLFAIFFKDLPTYAGISRIDWKLNGNLGWSRTCIGEIPIPICRMRYGKERKSAVRVTWRNNDISRANITEISTNSRSIDRPATTLPEFSTYSLRQCRKGRIFSTEEIRGREMGKRGMGVGKKRVDTFLRVFFDEERVGGQRTTRNKR